MSMTYVFCRNGYPVEARNSQLECLAYAKRAIGWDVYQGHSQRVDGHGVSHSSTYQVLEYEEAAGKGFRRTRQDVELTAQDAIPPYSEEEMVKLAMAAALAKEKKLAKKPAKKVRDHELSQSDSVQRAGVSDGSSGDRQAQGLQAQPAEGESLGAG